MSAEQAAEEILIVRCAHGRSGRAALSALSEASQRIWSAGSSIDGPSRTEAPLSRVTKECLDIVISARTTAPLGWRAMSQASPRPPAWSMGLCS